MSDCCDEPDCIRGEPFGLYLGWLSGTVYLVTRSGPGPNRQTRVARIRHNVTGTVEAFIRANPEWVQQVLTAQQGGERNG